MSNKIRNDVVTLIKLHDSLQFIANGNLETVAAANVLDNCGVVLLDNYEDMRDAIKGFSPTQAEILQGLGIASNNGSPETAELLDLYANVNYDVASEVIDGVANYVKGIFETECPDSVTAVDVEFEITGIDEQVHYDLTVTVTHRNGEADSTKQSFSEPAIDFLEGGRCSSEEYATVVWQDCWEVFGFNS